MMTSHGWLGIRYLNMYVTHGHVCHVIIFEAKFRYDTISINSDSLAMGDEELLRSGLVYLASAPAEVTTFQRLPLSLCRVGLHSMYAMTFRALCVACLWVHFSPTSQSSIGSLQAKDDPLKLPVVINQEGVITVDPAAQRTSQAVCSKNLGWAYVSTVESALQSKHSGEIPILRCTVQHPL
jgi:hypothetical protein